ncbi:hypothetical protein QJQ45_019233 [Haematococcus lacustris]|nr:hypothetical protein QJQ45_019233 [Haematococcus lacustris]
MGVKKPVFDHPSLKIGERVYSDLQPGQRMPILNWVVAVTTLALYCGWINLLIMLGVAAIWLVWPRYVLVLLWSTLLLPAKPVLWTAFCKLWVFKTWRQYFRYSYFFEEKLDPTKRYVLYEAPHGTFPIGPIVAGTLCQTFFPDAPIYSVAANSVFNMVKQKCKATAAATTAAYICLLLLRLLLLLLLLATWLWPWSHCSFISWIGSLPASKSNFKRLLDHGSVAVVVGGIAEMVRGGVGCGAVLVVLLLGGVLQCNPKKERIKMLGRKGFVRIALEEQVDGIVPVYYFFALALTLRSGNSQAFNFGPAFLEGVSRKWRTSLGVLYGVCGLPIPHPVQMYLVHGKPIPVPKVAKDDPEFERHVTELLDIAVKGMQDLYENHRKEYGRQRIRYRVAHSDWSCQPAMPDFSLWLDAAALLRRWPEKPLSIE